MTHVLTKSPVFHYSLIYYLKHTRLKTFIKMPSIFLFIPLYSTTGDRTYAIDNWLLSFHHIFEQTVCLLGNITVYFGLKFNLEVVLKSLKFTVKNIFKICCHNIFSFVKSTL